MSKAPLKALPSTISPDSTSKSLVLLAVQAAIDKKANYSLIYDVGTLGAFTDYFLITSGGNERQVQAIADSIRDTAVKAGFKKPTIEGYDEGRWVLVDFGDVVVHVFHDYIREFYDLESLWGEAKRIAIPKEFYTNNSSGRENQFSSQKDPLRIS